MREFSDGGWGGAGGGVKLIVELDTSAKQSGKVIGVGGAVVLTGFAWLRPSAFKVPVHYAGTRRTGGPIVFLSSLLLSLTGVHAETAG